MKKLVLSVIAFIGITLSVFGQEVKIKNNVFEVLYYIKCNAISKSPVA
jgi:hypothetical protein